MAVNNVDLFAMQTQPNFVANFPPSGPQPMMNVPAVAPMMTHAQPPMFYQPMPTLAAQPPLQQQQPMMYQPMMGVPQVIRKHSFFN